MGWFETEKFPDALIGDDPLDITGRFLEDFRDAYLDGPGRLPTVAELEATLAIVIGNVGGRWFEELDGKRVVKLALKTQKAPKRQDYAVGDIFAIPLTAGDYVFGRYIYHRPKEGGLIEIYGDIRDAPVFDDEVLEYELMGPPLWVSGHSIFEAGEFPILRHDPDYEPEGLDELEFLGGPPHDYKITRLDRTFVRRFDPAEWLEWKDRTFSLRNAYHVLEAVERWIGRRDDDGELIE
jgi:hypothetical protein